MVLADFVNRLPLCAQFKATGGEAIKGLDQPRKILFRHEALLAKTSLYNRRRLEIRDGACLSSRLVALDPR